MTVRSPFLAVNRQPSTVNHSQSMLETTTEVSCPYCGEPITLFLDLSIEEQSYIEDCSVCCQPMTVSFTVQDGEPANISVEAT